MKPNNVILLAAGTGSRLRPLTETMPKALVQCAGWPLLAYDLEFARRAVAPGGRVVVVAGYHEDLVRDYLEVEAPWAEVAVNPDFEKANILSVAAGVRAIDGDFLLMNVDHIYPWAFAERLAETPGDVVAATDFDRSLGADDMKVKLDADRNVGRISKKLGDFDCGYIGMTLVRPAGLAAWLAAFEAVLADHPEDGVAEMVVQRLADTGRPAAICDLSGLRWLEIDTVPELNDAESVLMDDPELLRRGFDDPRGGPIDPS
jgi:choline kinase